MAAFFDDISEADLSTYADMMEGLAVNATQLNSVSGQLINGVTGRISTNDAQLNKIAGLVKSQLTRQVTANGNTLATVSQPLQTAMAAQAGELSAQTSMVAANVPTATAGPIEGTILPADGQQIEIIAVLNAPNSNLASAVQQNNDIYQCIYRMLSAPYVQVPPNTPIGQYAYAIWSGEQHSGWICFAADKLVVGTQSGSLWGISSIFIRIVSGVKAEYCNELPKPSPSPIPGPILSPPPLSPPPPPLGPPSVSPQPPPPFPIGPFFPPPPPGGFPPGEFPPEPCPPPPCPPPTVVPYPYPVAYPIPIIYPGGTGPSGGPGSPGPTGGPYPFPVVFGPPGSLPPGFYPPGTGVPPPGTISAPGSPPSPPPPPKPLPEPQVIRVAGAGDERPDDEPNVAACVFTCTTDDIVPLVNPNDNVCQAMDRVYAGLVASGRQIIECSADSLGRVAYTTLSIFWFHNPDASYNQRLVEMICSALSEPKRSSWHVNLRSIIVSWPLADRDSVYPLLAVRRMLEEMDKIALEWGRSDNWGANIHSALGVDVHGFGVGIGETADESTHLDVAKSIRPLITYGMKIVELCLNKAQQIELPGVGDLIESLLNNTITTSDYICLMGYNGVRTDQFEPVVQARRERIVPKEFIQWSRRNGISDDDTIFKLRDYGYVNIVDAEREVELFDELPTINDHLHWLQRNAFDDAYVKDYNLLDGFATQDQIRGLPGYGDYVVKYPLAGRNFWQAFGRDLRSLGMKQEYASLHYAAHWINPSPGQLFEMLQRLRPGRVDPSLEFKESDLLRLLAEQDVAPYFRERFRAIAYSPFGLRFLRQLYDTRQIDDKEASQRFQDLGYKPSDADLLVKSELIRRARTVATQTGAYTTANIRKLFMSGKMNGAEAVQRLTEIGYGGETANTAINAWTRLAALKAIDDGAKAARTALITAAKESVQLGVISEQQAATTLQASGFSQTNALSLANTWVMMDRVKITKQGISQIRKGVMNGQLSIADSQPLLIHLGLTADKVNEYMNVWTYDLQAGKRFLAAAQITKMVEEGLMPMAVARARLANLNYADPDAVLLLAEAQQRILLAEQKAATAERKTEEAQAKALLKAIADNKKQLERFQKQLTGLGSVKTLTTWYRSGLIGPAYLRSRLEAMGYQDSDITLLIEEANIEGGTKHGTQEITPVNPGVGTTGPTPGSAGG